ncbi:MAG: EamA family transporter [Phycisphaerales bacterium]|nr:EamA family transporter [Hyphomonadaceae bacterium]
MAVWGTNFVVIAFALEHLPPLLLAALRFALVFVPMALFVKRPKVRLSNLAAYGLLIGAGQFGLLFLAMKNDITPGLASLVVQSQIFFTIALSMGASGERVQTYQWIALALATSGIVLIFVNSEGGTTPLGLALVLGAALCWALGNITARKAGGVPMLPYVVWSSIFAVPPLALLAFVFEGWPAIEQGLRSADAASWAAVLWQSVGNTMFGYTAWQWLLTKHPAVVVTPMALLVPIFGMSASAIVLSEPMPAWKLLAAGLVLAGLALNLAWPLVRRRSAIRVEGDR